MQIVALIGRPNVGKSTLFNRLVGKKMAITDDIAGVTRDRKEGVASLGPLRFKVLDTAGLEQAEKASLQEAMMAQTEKAIEEADVLCLMLDGRAGVTPQDMHFVEELRKRNRPVILVVNKCEGEKAQAGITEAFGLGFGEPVTISAEHGEGMTELYEALEPYVGEEDEEQDDVASEHLQLALAGRPNVGKSTLFNRLLKEERSIASDVAGTTRDAVYVDWEYDGTKVQLVDTAGLRKNSKRSGRLEHKSVEDSYRAIQYANVVVLVVDGNDPMNKIDLQLADHILSEGRAMVIAVNKWDMVEDKATVRADIKTTLEYSLAQAKGIPVVTMSALHGSNVHQIMAEAFAVFEAWNSRISTGKLNRWLEVATEQHVPPLSKGKRIRFRYITQAKSRPPTFILFTSSNLKQLPESYLRYLTNSIRDAFTMQGTPIRIRVRKGKNPYEK